jgi:hypothetical protein
MGKVREGPRRCSKRKREPWYGCLSGSEDVEVGNVGKGENRRADSSQRSKGCQGGLASNLC